MSRYDERKALKLGRQITRIMRAHGLNNAESDSDTVSGTVFVLKGQRRRPRFEIWLGYSFSESGNLGGPYIAFSSEHVAAGPSRNDLEFIGDAPFGQYLRAMQHTSAAVQEIENYLRQVGTRKGSTWYLQRRKIR